jgi:heme-degrading monooxygenase HmoA
VRPPDVDRYLSYQSETGIAEYRRSPGNLGALVLTRRQGALVEVKTVSLWTSMEAVADFAGDDPARARFYPRDEAFLVERDSHVDHFDVASAYLDGVGLTFEHALRGSKRRGGSGA